MSTPTRKSVPGVVKYWELEVNGQHLSRFRTWEDGTDAFRDTVASGANTAVLYAVSKGNRIATWKHGDV